MQRKAQYFNKNNTSSAAKMACLTFWNHVTFLPCQLFHLINFHAHGDDKTVKYSLSVSVHSLWEITIKLSIFVLSAIQKRALSAKIAPQIFFVDAAKGEIQRVSINIQLIGN